MTSSQQSSDTETNGMAEEMDGGERRGGKGKKEILGHN